MEPRLVAYGWTQNGPVALPPRAMAYGVGALLIAMALVGLTLGYRAAQRQTAAPGLDDVASSVSDGVLIARPIVELPPPVAAAPAPDDAAKAAADKAKADDIATKAAAAQAVQTKPSKGAGDIDEILASPTEKPPAPAKATADEAPPPGPPVKSDVPF